jgi:hypothetical protein
MRLRTLTLGLSMVLCVLAGTPGQTADQILIPPGAVWRYNDSGTNLGTGWRAVGYNDAAWATGPAQLGYGDGDEATLVGYGPDPQNKHVTTWFRRSFALADPTQVRGLWLRVLQDDGAVVHLNGTRVFRRNVPQGALAPDTLAASAIAGADENALVGTPVDPRLLVAGTNVLAVEMRQSSPQSSDLSFDLELWAQ